MKENDAAPGDASPSLSASLEDRLRRQFDTLDTLFGIIVKKEMENAYLRDYNIVMALRAQNQCRNTAHTLSRIAKHEKTCKSGKRTDES
jgi:hypothetical protein